MLGLAKTCKKLKISFFDYLGARLGIPGPQIPSLANPRPPSAQLSHARESAPVTILPASASRKSRVGDGVAREARARRKMRRRAEQLKVGETGGSAMGDHRVVVRRSPPSRPPAQQKSRPRPPPGAKMNSQTILPVFMGDTIVSGDPNLALFPPC